MQATISRLIDTRFRENTHANLAAKTGAVIVGSWLLAASAQIAVPMWPVPMTMQTLAVLLIGAGYGLRLGTATVALYLFQGAMGLPFFAGGAGGFMHLLGPTGGYLLGFVLAAAATGRLADSGRTETKTTLAATLAVGTAAIFLPGIAWLSFYTGPGAAVMSGLVPFIPGALIKGALAFGLLLAARKRL